MEIKINSNAEINVSNSLDVEFVEAKVSSYKLKEQSLSGDVLIYVKYKKYEIEIVNILLNLKILFHLQ